LSFEFFNFLKNGLAPGNGLGFCETKKYAVLVLKRVAAGFPIFPDDLTNFTKC
jgi:hypothetical protein